MTENPEDIKSRIQQIMGKAGLDDSNRDKIKPDFNTAKRSVEFKPADNMAKEVEQVNMIDSTADSVEGTVFLIWFDNDTYAQMNGIQQAFPTKSEMSISQFYDFDSQEMKTKILADVAKYIQDFESAEDNFLNTKGKYFVIIGKKVSVKITKTISIEG